MPTSVANVSNAVSEGRVIFMLASRLLAAEIDVPLYRALLVVDDDGRTGCDGLIDDHIRALDEDDAVDELAVEFCRLFLGPRPACPPYESVRRGEAMLGGRAERRLKEYMARHGLEAELPSEFPVLSYDHLAVHFALLHRLCDSPPERPGPDSPDPLRELLELHLLPWAPAYLRDLQAASHLAPYRTIAELTARFLTEGLHL